MTRKRPDATADSPGNYSEVTTKLKNCLSISFKKKSRLCNEISSSRRIRDSGVQRTQSLSVVENKDEAKGENSHHVDAQRQQEEEEVAVVPPADAVVHPGTVMVEILRRRKWSYTSEMHASCIISHQWRSSS